MNKLLIAILCFILSLGCVTMAHHFFPSLLSLFFAAWGIIFSVATLFLGADWVENYFR